MENERKATPRQLEQQAETNEVLEEFNKAKAEGRQPLCPYCHKPLEIGQFYSVYVAVDLEQQKETLPARGTRLGRRQPLL